MKSFIITVCAVLLLAACGQEAEKSAPSADAEKTEPLAEVTKETEKAETTKPEPAEKPEPMADVAKETEKAETTTPEPAEKPEPMAEVANETEEAASEAAAPETVVEEVDETVVEETASAATEETAEAVVEDTAPAATTDTEETAVEETAVEETAVEETTVERTPSLPGAKVFFIMPKDGATVRSPIPLQFGVEGMDVAPAGQDDVHSGHHHLLIDGKLQDYNAPIPSDANHKHYGGAQTETAIGLEPGKHTLQLILGDHNHIPHDPPVESDVITITVE